MDEILFCEECHPSYDEMFYYERHGTNENEIMPSIEIALENIDNAITFLQISSGILTELKMLKKMKSINGIVKNIEIFKKSIRK